MNINELLNQRNTIISQMNAISNNPQQAGYYNNLANNLNIVEANINRCGYYIDQMGNVRQMQQQVAQPTQQPYYPSNQQQAAFARPNPVPQYNTGLVVPQQQDEGVTSVGRYSNRSSNNNVSFTNDFSNNKTTTTIQPVNVTNNRSTIINTQNNSTPILGYEYPYLTSIYLENIKEDIDGNFFKYNLKNKEINFTPYSLDKCSKTDKTNIEEVYRESILNNNFTIFNSKFSYKRYFPKTNTISQDEDKINIQLKSQIFKGLVDTTFKNIFNDSLISGLGNEEFVIEEKYKLSNNLTELRRFTEPGVVIKTSDGTKVAPEYKDKFVTAFKSLENLIRSIEVKNLDENDKDFVEISYIIPAVYLGKELDITGILENYYKLDVTNEKVYKVTRNSFLELYNVLEQVERNGTNCILLYTLGEDMKFQYRHVFKYDNNYYIVNTFYKH